jgi:hypothetical protein
MNNNTSNVFYNGLRTGLDIAFPKELRSASAGRKRQSPLAVVRFDSFFHGLTSVTQ